MKRIAKRVETTELCSYGCGETANFLNGSNNLMCQDRCTKCPALRKKNSENPGKRADDKGQKWRDAMAAKRGTTARNHYSKAEELGIEKPVLSEESRLRMSEKAKKKRHSQETKELISQKARASKHRRLKRGIVMYKGVMLDSSWELALAERLDFLGIKWSRPDPLIWEDKDGKSRNYFPDFYLPDYNVYLDPKNSYAYQSQLEKLEVVLRRYKNIIILKTLKDCKDFSI